MKNFLKWIGIGISITLLAGILYLFGIRQQFASYLKVAYPDKSFHVGLVGVDILYDKYYAEVTCKEDKIKFSVIKAFSSSHIEDNYLEMHIESQNRLIAEELFQNTVVEPYIHNASLLTSKLEPDNRNYEILYLHLTMDCDPIKTIEEVQKIVQNSTIKVTTLNFLYEKEKHVYEVYLPTYESFTNEELKSKIVQVK